MYQIDEVNVSNISRASFAMMIPNPVYISKAMKQLFGI